MINSQKENVVDRVMEITGAQGVQVSVSMASAEGCHQELAYAFLMRGFACYCVKLPNDLHL